MKLEDLRRLIKEEVEHALDEADKKAKAPPKTFADFRKLVGAAAKKAKAPKDFVEEIVDVDVEGGGVPEALWGAWRNIEVELKDETDPVEQWDMIAYYVHDAIIDAVSEYENAWNYAPGAKKGQKPVDDVALAKAVQSTVAAMGPKRPPKLKAPAGEASTKAIIAKLKDDLETEGSTVTVVEDDGVEAVVRIDSPGADPVRVADYMDESMVKRFGFRFAQEEKSSKWYELRAEGGSLDVSITPRGDHVEVRVYTDTI